MNDTTSNILKKKKIFGQLKKEPVKQGHVRLVKCQLILKANCQAIDSPKKRTNEFAFLT